jgi:hypothetical protein
LAGFAPNAGDSGKPDLEAGGIAHATLYAGYQARSGARIDEAAVRYWEVMAHLRWAVILWSKAIATFQDRSIRVNSRSLDASRRNWSARCFG